MNFQIGTGETMLESHGEVLLSIELPPAKQSDQAAPMNKGRSQHTLFGSSK
jgi:hypothetical protein